MKYDAKQIIAIQQAINLGRKLQEDIPQIAEDYRNRKNKRQIIGEYKIPEIYNVNEKIAFVAVGYALRGNTRFVKTKQYEGLITDSSELEKLCSEHQRDNLEKIKKDLNNEYLQRGARNSNLTQGKVLWSDRERNFVYQLSKKAEYKIKTIKNSVLIAKEINRRFHNNQQVRTVSAINNLLTHYKKIKGKWVRIRR